MSSKNTILRFSYPLGSNSDARTFTVTGIGSFDETELYRFYHPITGLKIGMTTFYRQNLDTQVFETAGQIEWMSNTNAIVQFGIEEISIRDLRKAKKSNSKSRRFKIGGSEYRWKVAGNGNDLYCVDSRGRTVATWSQEQLQLIVMPRAESIMDRVVVTCMLNLWIKQVGQW